MYNRIIGGRKGMGGKKESWVVAIEKQSKKVPGVGSHSKVREWSKVNGGLMATKDRVTTQAEIFKGKPTPGPSHFKCEAAAMKYNGMSAPYSPKINKAEHLSMFADIAESKKGNPMNFPAKETVQLIKPKPRYTSVEKNIPRLPVTKKVDHPNPATYKAQDSYKKAVLKN